MENQLITPERVIEIAFAGCDYTDIALVTSAVIEAAQRRFLLPILGAELIAALLDERYETLYDEYVEPVIAYYARVEMTPLSDRSRRDALHKARFLACRLSDHLEENSQQYTEYKSEHNVLNKIRLYGDTIERA